jgi:hypothetical protein
MASGKNSARPIVKNRAPETSQDPDSPVAKKPRLHEVVLTIQRNRKRFILISETSQIGDSDVSDDLSDSSRVVKKEKKVSLRVRNTAEKAQVLDVIPEVPDSALSDESEPKIAGGSKKKIRKENKKKKQTNEEAETPVILELIKKKNTLKLSSEILQIDDSELSDDEVESKKKRRARRKNAEGPQVILSFTKSGGRKYRRYELIGDAPEQVEDSEISDFNEDERILPKKGEAPVYVPAPTVAVAKPISEPIQAPKVSTPQVHHPSPFLVGTEADSNLGYTKVRVGDEISLPPIDAHPPSVTEPIIPTISGDWYHKETVSVEELNFIGSSLFYEDVAVRYWIIREEMIRLWKFKVYRLQSKDLLFREARHLFSEEEDTTLIFKTWKFLKGKGIFGHQADSLPSPLVVSAEESLETVILPLPDDLVRYYLGDPDIIRQEPLKLLTHEVDTSIDETLKLLVSRQTEMVKEVFMLLASKMDLKVEHLDSPVEAHSNHSPRKSAKLALI